jgi:hypothetical protein
MGIFFDDPKPRVTKLEWKRVRGILYDTYHYTTKELDAVEEIFRGDMDEEKERDKGIDTDELVKGIQYMRQHMNLHHISLEKIDGLEKEMMKKIATIS